MSHINTINNINNELIVKISREFYNIMRKDDLIGKMYPPNDWEGAEERLRNFLLFRFLGDETYIQERGHPRLRMRHAPYLIGEKERDRWMEIMDEAMLRSDVPEETRQSLHDFFAGVADFMRNH